MDNDQIIIINDIWQYWTTRKWNNDIVLHIKSVGNTCAQLYYSGRCERRKPLPSNTLDSSSNEPRSIVPPIIDIDSPSESEAMALNPLAASRFCITIRFGNYRFSEYNSVLLIYLVISVFFNWLPKKVYIPSWRCFNYYYISIDK